MRAKIPRFEPGIFHEPMRNSAGYHTGACHRALADSPPLELLMHYRGQARLWKDGQRNVAHRIENSVDLTQFAKWGFALQLFDLDSIFDTRDWVAWAEQHSNGKGFGLMAFYSPGNELGANVHCDPTDGIIIQLFGRKTYFVSDDLDSVYSNPVQPFGVGMIYSDSAYRQPQLPPIPDRSTMRTIVANPGDVLTLPSGVWHATSSSEESLSLSISVRAFRGTDALASAFNRLAPQFSLAREPLNELPISNRAERVRTLSRTYTKILEEMTDDEVLALIGEKQVVGEAYSDSNWYHPRSCAELIMSPVSADSDVFRVEVKQNFGPSFAGSPSLRKRCSFQISTGCEELIIWLRESTGFSIRQLEQCFSEFEKEDLCQLVEQLTAAGFLRQADVPMGLADFAKVV